MVDRFSLSLSLSLSISGSYACNITANVVRISVNQFPINILTNYGTNACQCNSCDGAWKFSSTFDPISIADYHYGGNNVMNLTVLSGSLCLNSINLTVYWAPPRMFDLG
jgi:hypothetical protein